MKYSTFLLLVASTITEAQPWICNNLRFSPELKIHEKHCKKLAKTIRDTMARTDSSTLTTHFRRMGKTSINTQYVAEKKAWLVKLSDAYKKRGA